MVADAEKRAMRDRLSWQGMVEGQGGAGLLGREAACSGLWLKKEQPKALPSDGTTVSCGKDSLRRQDEYP